MTKTGDVFALVADSLITIKGQSMRINKYDFPYFEVGYTSLDGDKFIDLIPIVKYSSNPNIRNITEIDFFIQLKRDEIDLNKSLKLIHYAN